MRSKIGKRKIGWLARRVMTVSHHSSYLLAKQFRTALPITFVTGYPKSGTVWACQMISDCLGLPFADLSLFPIGFPSLMHGHYRVWPDSPRSVYVVRDGRDTLVSMYFYLARFVPEGDNPRGAPRRVRQYFEHIKNRDDVRENLPKFIEAQMRRPLGTWVHWGEHVRAYYESGRTDVPLMKYEEMLEDCEAVLTRVARELTGEEPDPEEVRHIVWKYSFQRQTGRKPGTEDRSSFVRKGQSGDWRNHFSREAAEVFHRYAGAELIRLGYEKDDSWVEQCQ